MTAITVSYNAKVASDWDPDKPLTTTKLNNLFDDVEFVKQWLGEGYIAGAVQDHDHDGTNSAKITVGANMLRNGDFEGGLTSWIATQYGGGTVWASTADSDGTGSLAITSTVLGNGGGDILSGEYMVVDGGEAYCWAMNQWASIANVSSKLEAEFYDSTKAHISTSTLATTTATPTTNTLTTGVLIAPTNARYMKIRATGGIPGSGTAVGTVTFDSLFVTRAPAGTLINQTYFNASGTFVPTPATQTIIAQIVGGGGGGGGCAASGTGGAGGGAGVNRLKTISAPISASYAVTVGAGGTGTSGGNGTPGGATSLGSYVATGGRGGIAGSMNGSGEGGENNIGAGGANTSTTGAGNSAAANSGAGGGGAYTTSSAQAGGSGGNGMVIIWEFA